MLLLDLDGVLVDFIHGTLVAHGIDKTTEEIYRGYEGDWNLNNILKLQVNDFWLPMDRDFWANLPWMPDGKEIFELTERIFGRENIRICTSPSLNDGCLEGKRDWIKKHLPSTYLTRINFTNEKFLLASPRNILVDDSDSNLHKFVQHDGTGILVPRIWNSRHYQCNETIERLTRTYNSYV